ncbi:MAG: trehalose-phosphatase [Candidatus Omnitrophica bacterium]|nr:trehalose-phosphatase [Candidatus Omnitrophota bacterium]
MRYLFNEWDALKGRIQGRYLFLFLDFDGTLAPIAETPAKAVIPQETKKLLNKLAKRKHIRIAIISGRSLGNIKNKLGLNNIIYSGNHGLEIEGPKVKFSPLISRGYKIALKTIKNTLARKLRLVKGVILEDKSISLSLHYRLVDDKQVFRVKTIFHETVIRYLLGDRIKAKEGKKVLEVRPPLEWDKGKVILWLLARQKFAKYGNKILPLYIGDDLTDEDAFKALRRIGITVFVGRPTQSSKAKYYLKDTCEVTKLLRGILEIQSENQKCKK